MDASGETLITVENWGSIDGQILEKFTLKGKGGQEVDIVTYGATITSIRTPNKQNTIDDVVLGFDNIEGYLSTSNPYFGATIGRVANRIGKAEFVLDGKKYRLARNAGQNSLHGGFKGWNSKVWRGSIQKNKVVMSVVSDDGDEGYPGAVTATITFALNENGELIIEMEASTKEATLINLTNHSYFNLAGHQSNVTELYNHLVTLNADRWTVTDSESIPTGEIRSVNNTVMDLRNSTKLGDVIHQVPGGGYDYNFCITEHKITDERQFVARVVHPHSGRYLEVYSNQPGVQFYTANFLPEQGKPGIRGKGGKEYFKHGAFCLETQNYPDAVHHDNFPKIVFRPGEVYHHLVVYKFGLLN